MRTSAMEADPIASSNGFRVSLHTKCSWGWFCYWGHHWNTKYVVFIGAALCFGD